MSEETKEMEELEEADDKTAKIRKIDVGDDEQGDPDHDGAVSKAAEPKAKKGKAESKKVKAESKKVKEEWRFNFPLQKMQLHNYESFSSCTPYEISFRGKTS